MTKKVKASMTANSGVERSLVKLLTKDGVSVTYDCNRAELVYEIPTGYTIGELRDWRLKYNSLIQPELVKKGILPNERTLRELSLSSFTYKRKRSTKKEGLL